VGEEVSVLYVYMRERKRGCGCVCKCRTYVNQGGGQRLSSTHIFMKVVACCILLAVGELRFELGEILLGVGQIMDEIDVVANAILLHHERRYVSQCIYTCWPRPGGVLLFSEHPYLQVCAKWHHTLY